MLSAGPLYDTAAFCDEDGGMFFFFFFCRCFVLLLALVVDDYRTFFPPPPSKVSKLAEAFRFVCSVLAALRVAPCVSLFCAAGAGQLTTCCCFYWSSTERHSAAVYLLSAHATPLLHDGRTVREGSNVWHSYIFGVYGKCRTGDDWCVR